MHTPIWLRILIAVDLLVIASSVAIGWFSSEIAGRVVEERLIRETARRTGEFLSSQNLPFTDTLMGYLRRMHGAHFVTIRLCDRAVVGSSLPAEVGDQLRANAALLAPSGVVTLGGATYRYDSHEIDIRGDRDSRAPAKARLYALVPREEFVDARMLAARRIAKASAVVLAGASVLAILVAFPIARPMRKLAARMAAIEARPADAGAAAQSASGDICCRRGPREVVKLARAFDNLMARLAEARGDLARHARLATLGRIAASVVHELRNPLSGIRMNLRVLQEELADRGIDSEGLAAGAGEVERMGLYLDELTDLASSTSLSGGSALPRLGTLGAVRLEDLADSVLAILAGRCRHSAVKVVRRYDPSAAAVHGDGERLRQVIMNMVANALAAMPNGGTMEVSVQPAGRERVRCTIGDTGDGIRSANTDELFEPFFTTASRSAGLGLYVSRQIVDAHGGLIGCGNTDKGAAFWFEIAVSPPPGQDNHQQEARRDG